MKGILPILMAAALVPAALEAQQNPQLIGEGARVYASNCARCHNARSSTERTDAQWAMVVSHMRARANFTKREAAAVLAYLQATNLPEPPAGGAADADRSLVVLPPALADALRDLSAVADEPEPPGESRRKPDGR